LSYFYLDAFKYDEEYEFNEKKYPEMQKPFFNQNSDAEDGPSSNSLENNNDQSNIQVADTSSDSSAADKEN
jgi:hypothetical protein